jgi:Arc/MetJ family transcription regulator
MSSEFVRKTFTIPADLVEAVEAIIGEKSMSAYVSQAVRHQVRQDHLDRLAAQAEAANGPLTQQEIDQRVKELVG